MYLQQLFPNFRRSELDQLGWDEFTQVLALDQPSSSPSWHSTQPNIREEKENEE